MADNTQSLERGVELLRERIAVVWDSPFQARRVVRILERFVAFTRTGFRVTDPMVVTPTMVERFVAAPSDDGVAASVSLQHLRRSALRLLFRVMRDVGAMTGDPTIDMVLPPRSQLSARPLEDDEIALCRGHALWSLGDLRRAAAWALAESTCRSVEIAQIRVRDVDLEMRRVWIHDGRTTSERWGDLSDWAATHLEHRVRTIRTGPDTPIVYAGAGGHATGQVSSCRAIIDVLTRAGLAAEPDVRPGSVVAWAGRRILAETGRIDEVARRLGMSSLDRAAKFIGYDWNASQ